MSAGHVAALGVAFSPLAFVRGGKCRGLYGVTVERNDSQGIKRDGRRGELKRNGVCIVKPPLPFQIAHRVWEACW